jgi:hypothetical protein
VPGRSGYATLIGTSNHKEAVSASPTVAGRFVW